MSSVAFAVVGDFGNGYYSVPLFVSFSRDVAERRADVLRADPAERLGYDGFEVVEVEAG